MSDLKMWEKLVGDWFYETRYCSYHERIATMASRAAAYHEELNGQNEKDKSPVPEPTAAEKLLLEVADRLDREVEVWPLPTIIRVIRDTVESARSTPPAS